MNRRDFLKTLAQGAAVAAAAIEIADGVGRVALGERV